MGIILFFCIIFDKIYAEKVELFGQVICGVNFYAEALAKCSEICYIKTVLNLWYEMQLRKYIS